MKYDIDAVKEAADCLEYARDVLQIEVSKEGRCAAVWRGGERSDSVSLSAKGYHDFAEDDSGSVIDLVMNIRGIGFQEALEEVATYYRVDPQPDKRIVATYPYKSLDGKLLFEVVRYSPKAFRQRQPAADGGWTWSLKGVQRVPYRLPDWSERDWVIVVEGEKDADTVLDQLGLPATTFPQGAGNIKDEYEYPRWFKGKKLVVLPDNDPKGLYHAELVVWHLRNVVKEAKLIRISSLDGGDVTDWVQGEGGDRVQLYERMHEASVIDLPRLAKPKAPVTEKQKKARQKNGKKSSGRPSIDYSDLAAAFMKHHSVDGLPEYRHYKGAWYRYDGSCYCHIKKDTIRAAVMTYLLDTDPAAASTNARDNAIGCLLSWTHAEIPEWVPMPCWLDDDYADASGWLSMGNRIINLRNAARAIAGEDVPDEEISRDPTPALFSTFSVDYEFDPDAECPMFLDYLEDVQLPPDRAILRQMMGLSLIPETKYNVAFFLFGQAGTGKSVYLHVLSHLVGVQNVCCVPLSSFSERFSTWPLTVKLLNIVGEMPTDDGRTSIAQVEGMLKDVTDGGLVPVEHKNEDRYEAPVIARCVLATNELPRFYDRSDGLWDRIRIIAFDRRIRGTDKENPSLRDDIVKDELPGVFNWALMGLADLLQQRSFPEHSRGEEIKRNHRQMCDQEGAFLADFYQQAPADRWEATWIPSKDVYDHYKEYAKDAGFRPKSQPKFNLAVERAFGVRAVRFRTADGKQLRGFQGIQRILETVLVSSGIQNEEDFV